MSNRRYKNDNVPKKIKVSKSDIVLFSDLSFFVNLTTYAEKDSDEYELELRENINIYDCVSHDVYPLIQDVYGLYLHDKDDRHFMRKYNHLINVRFPM